MELASILRNHRRSYPNGCELVFCRNEPNTLAYEQFLSGKKHLAQAR